MAQGAHTQKSNRREEIEGLQAEGERKSGDGKDDLVTVCLSDAYRRRRQQK
jgi:hypothetical protein